MDYVSEINKISKQIDSNKLEQAKFSEKAKELNDIV